MTSMLYLVTSCKTQLMIEATGAPLVIPSPEICERAASALERFKDKTVLLLDIQVLLLLPLCWLLLTRVVLPLGSREIPGGLRVSAHIDDGERIPAILLLPTERPAPAALLIHGYTSHKERMAESVGMALLRRGVGSGVGSPGAGNGSPFGTAAARTAIERVQRRDQFAVNAKRQADQSRSTLMNVTGFSIAAGSLFTYVDYVHARNQPFVGGSMAGDSAEEEQRFIINIGYYF